MHRPKAGEHRQTTRGREAWCKVTGTDRAHRATRATEPMHFLCHPQEVDLKASVPGRGTDKPEMNLSISKPRTKRALSHSRPST